MKYVIRFRHVSPSDYMTPLMYIPIEETIVGAETPDLAWASFVGRLPINQQDRLKREEIFQYT